MHIQEITFAERNNKTHKRGCCKCNHTITPYDNEQQKTKKQIMLSAPYKMYADLYAFKLMVRPRKKKYALVWISIVKYLFRC